MSRPRRFQFPLMSLLIVVLLLQTFSWRLPSSQGRETGAELRATDPQGPLIQLLTRSFVPTPGLDLALRDPELARSDKPVHVLLQLDGIPTPSERAALRSQGVTLQHYVPQQAWIALLPASQLTALASQRGVRWVGAWTLRDKLSPRLAKGEIPSWATHESGRAQVMLLPHADVSLASAEALATSHGGVVAGQISAPRALTVWIHPENLPGLAMEEGVLWIEEAPPPLSPTNDDARRTLRVEALGNAPYNLDGSGVRLFVFDGGRVFAHTALAGRLTYVDNSLVIDHATHVAGTAAGDGTGAPPGRDLRGMAPAAQIYSAGYFQLFGTALFWDNAGDIQFDYAAARNTHGVDLATNSIGSNTASNGFNCDIEGDYGVSAAMIDAIVRGDNPTVGSPYVTIWANGNERTGTTGLSPGRCGSNYRTTAPPSCAKNPIHVGATNSDGDSMTSFSSWGPCDDGRLKPVVSGPGCESGRVNGEDVIYSTLTGDAYGGYCGTSMATPAVAGVATLAIQQYRKLTGDPLARPSNALMKTWLIHTARDLGNDGPDYVYGYGEVDATAMMDLITSTANYTSGLISASGVTDTYSYQVPVGTRQLKISLAWDDYAAAAFVANATVNDLDLLAEAPDGTLYYPYSLDPVNPHLPATNSGPNPRDNQEQIVIPNPAPGAWTIHVRGSSVPQAPQAYALAYTHELGIASCAPGLQNGDLETGIQNWVLDGASRVASPGTPPQGGSWSLRLGGSTSVNHGAYMTASIPAEVDAGAHLSFSWYMTTTEGAFGHSRDKFYAEVRDILDNPLTVYELRNDGWLTNTWLLGDNIDLSTYAGQTLRVAFHAENSPFLETAFFVDDVQLDLCRQTAVLQIGKTALPNPAIANRPLTYTLWLTNAGMAPAPDLVITDALPLNTTWSSGGTLSGDVVSFTLSNLDAAQSISRSFVVTVADVPSGTLLLNDRYRVSSSEGVSHTGTPLTTSVQVLLPELYVRKTTLPNPAIANRPLTYTLWVTNSGTLPATDLLITDALPLNTTWATGGTLSGDVVSFTLSDLYAAQSITRSFVVTVADVPSGTLLLNDRYRVSSSEGVSHTGTALTTPVHILSPELHIGKTALPNPAVANRPLTYTLWVTNAGAIPATDLVITDALPLNTTWSSGGTLSGDVVSFTLSNLDAAQSISRSFVVTVADVASGTLLLNDRYRVSSSEEVFHEGQSITTRVTVLLPELQLSKKATPSPAFSNQPLTYTFWITNEGIGTATELVLTDVLPTNTTWRSGGTLLVDTVHFDISALQPGTTSSVTFAVTVGDVPSGTQLLNDQYRVSSLEGVARSGNPVVTFVHEPGRSYPIFLPFVTKSGLGN